MYKIYMKQAWALIRQEKLFSGVYIVGTGLAISMVMALAVAYHIRTANLAPEVYRDRMAYMENVSYRPNDDSGALNSSCGTRLAKEVLYGLETPEEVTLRLNASSLSWLFGSVYLQIPGGSESPKVETQGCDAAFWRVYRFAFLEGGPFTEADFRSATPRIVLCESLARRLFTGERVTGQTVLLNGLEYTVSGVVADVSGVTPDAYSEAWIPYSTIPVVMDGELSEREGSAGWLTAAFLLRDISDLPALSAELRQAVAKYNGNLVQGQIKYGEPYTYINGLLSGLFGENTYIVLGSVLLLFLLVPALNLSGLNASKIRDRVAELGVRKAFGATRKELMGQIFAENLLLMLPGGVLGLLFSYVLVYIFRKVLLQSFYSAMAGKGVALTLSPEMLLNLDVFAYAFVTCLVLNLLSSMIPAWRTIRMTITEALNG